MTSLAYLSARFRRHLVPVMLVLTLLGGCSLVEGGTEMRGHKVDEDVLKELLPGTSSRADVIALLGSPTARALFDDDTWIYVASITRSQIARYPSIETQDVTVLRFTPTGTLKDIRLLKKDDAVPVAVVGRATPSPGSEMNFLQDFTANIGRLAPSAAGGVGKKGGGI